MTAGLRLGEGLVLPQSFATEGVAAIGMRGSGKSNTLVRWAEVLYKAGIPFVAVDPKGDWHGIRSSADGKSPGLSVPVFGGLTEDFPLEETMGVQIADLLVDNNLSAVLDVSRLSIAARGRFLTHFCNQLMERHQREPHVRCVILEEAHRYIPQQVPGPLAAVKEAAAALLLEGRAFGLGCWAATQRPARLHKDVLEEVGTAIVHRIGAAATNDLKTIKGWVQHEDLSDEIIPSLTKLASGEAWVLAPSTLGIAKRVQIDRRTTYDSASTPLVGAGSRPTLTMADIDAAAIKEALADSIERAKADDPKELHKQIKQLRRELAERPAVEPERVEVEIPVPYVPDALGEHLVAAVGSLQGALALVRDLPDRPGGARQAVPPPVRQAPVKPTVPTAKASPRPTRPSPPRAASGAGDSALSGPQRKLLTVLATYGPRSKRQLAMQAGYSAKGGGFNNPLSALRSAGLVQRGDPIVITPAGIDALGEYDPLPTGPALVDHWMGQLTGPERKILQPLLDAHPVSMSKDELADAAGYDPDGGGFNNPLSRLRSLELVRRGTDIGLTDEFAEAIR